MKSFVMIVEGREGFERTIEYDEDSPPYLITVHYDDDVVYYVKLGRYASPGDRYAYRRVEPFPIRPQVATDLELPS